LNQIGSPNKLFEAMVCGRPIIASKGTYSGKLVEELTIGVSIDFSEKSLIQAVKKLRDDPELCEKYGHNALNAALSEYNWENQEKKLLQLYDELNNK
jgi:glycosyltransferase involved in cell wall biosynthesis